MSSLIHKTSCIIFIFLVLWSIHLSSSLVYFKKGSNNLTRGFSQVFIPLMRTLLQRFVLRSFIILLRYSFKLFLHIHLLDSVCFQYSQILVVFLFSQHSNTFLILVVLFLLLFLFSHFSSLTWWHAQNIVRMYLPQIITCSNLWLTSFAHNTSTTKRR